MRAAVPLIEIADDADALRVGRPDAELHAGDAVDFADVRAELVERAVMRAFGEKMQIEIAEEGREVVGVKPFAIRHALLAHDPAIGVRRQAAAGREPGSVAA